MMNTAKHGFRRAILIGIIIMTGAQFCQAAWPPNNVDVFPQDPNSCDVVVITLSGSWPDTGVPDSTAVSVSGNNIYFDVINQWPGGMTVVTPWERRRSVGPLAAGTYTVYTRLIGRPSIPETYSQITQFAVTTESHAVTTYYVDGVSGNDNNDGLTMGSAFAKIQTAVDTAKTGDSVIVAEDVYTGVGNHTIDFHGKALSVRSVDPNDPAVVAATVIDCQLSGSGFRFRSNEPQNARVSGLTIVNASSSGIYCDDYSSPTIDKCAIVNNQGFRGGGIYCNSYSSPTIRSCTISSNTAGNDGGGIYCVANSAAIIMSCVIGDNVSGDYGGGIYVGSRAAPTIAGCTITNNIAAQGGGGINVSFVGEAAITDCILWDNGASSGSQIAILDANCSVSYSNVQGGQGDVYVNIRPDHGCDDCTLSWGTGNIDADPCFVDASGDDYHLRWDSVCINVGDPGYAAGVDERDVDGEPRIMAGRVDMGADEVGEKQADFTRDGIIDTDDGIVFLQAWLSTAGDANWYLLCDLYGDGKIDLDDWDEFAMDWQWRTDWYGP